MTYRMSLPPINLSWFQHDVREVTDDDLVQVLLKDGARLHFRFGVVGSSSEQVWYLDKELLPNFLESYLDGNGSWILPHQNRQRIHVGSRVKLEHSLSLRHGNHCIDFVSSSLIVAIQPVHRSECRRPPEIRGYISVAHPDGRDMHLVQTCS